MSVTRLSTSRTGLDGTDELYNFYQSSRVKLVSGLVARRHVDLLRVIAMACPFLG